MPFNPYCNSPPDPGREYLLLNVVGEALCDKHGEAVRFDYEKALMAERCLKLHNRPIVLLTAEDFREGRPS